jgi:saccharopine dehydrogenase-like NADP-dependent oxidoreductase
MAPLKLKYHLPLLLLALVASFFYLKTQTPEMTPKTTPLRKIAVTGSNGSVGKRVVLRALAHGYHVVGIDYSTLATADGRDLGSNFSFLQVDLKDYNETLKAFGLPGFTVASASNHCYSRRLKAAMQSSI